MRDQTIYAHRSTRSTRSAQSSSSFVGSVLTDRLSDSQAIATIVVVIVGAFYSVSHVPLRLGSYHFTLRRLLWELVVALIPALVLQVIDRFLNPLSNITPMTLTLPHAAKSDALARILGMDKPGGIMATVSQARRRLSSVSSPFAPEKCKPPGLGNWDNSCYQNSVLQGLSSLTPLPEYLAGPEDAPDMPESSTTHSLLTLIADLNSSTNNGRTLWTPAILKSMSSRIQQDAQEYFSKLLDEIDKELLRAVGGAYKPQGLETKNQHDTEINDRAKVKAKVIDGAEIGAATSFRNPLEGLVAQRVSCVQCGYSEGLSMIPFICLTLNLGTDPAPCDLFQRLDAYTNVESIEGVHCGKCTLLKNKQIMLDLIGRFRASGVPEDKLSEHVKRLEEVETALAEDDFEDKTLRDKCNITAQNKVSSTKTKQMVIARPPRSLVVHINRSVFDERTFMLMKNPAPVRFPVDLDIGPWCLGSAPGSGSSSESGPSEEDVEHWITKADASMAAGESVTAKVTGPIYELRAVVTHQGRHDNGHYVCYRKHSGINKLQAFEQSRAADMDPGNQDIELETLSKDQFFSQDHWWRLSDETVTKCSEDDVLAQGGAFMLFYDCVDEVPVRTANLDEGDAEAEKSEEYDVVSERADSAMVLDSSEDWEVSGRVEKDEERVSEE
ncbi:hypothetical protein TD95_000657 [Thielaviopsis punctulata]|uniref:ubiquitinyl hydrolase 1 n=1 Tax=Thielaviopsis punctulata TaxID=72032 RepID=A0A0F4ZIM9_9PEZI|nr:hypothetical protein TD95_000657 [Thielaviopsis punctulata]